MIKRFLLLAVMMAVLLIPTVSAEELIDSGVNSAAFTQSKDGYYGTTTGQITFYNIAEWHGLESVYIKGDLHADSVNLLKSTPSYSRAVTAKIGNTVIGTGEAGYNGFFDAAGNPTGVQCWVDFDTWDIGTRTGTQSIVLIPVSGTIFNGIKFHLPSPSSGYTSTDAPAGFSYDGRLHSGSHIVRSSYYWKNAVEDTGESIVLTRNFDGTAYQSNLIVTYGATTITDGRAVNLEIPYAGSGTWNVTNPYGRTYSGVLGSGSGTPQPPPPDTWVPCTINVYDADTRLPLSGSWDYYIVIQGADAVSGSASGAFKVVNLPVTSILKPHLLYVTKEGYEMTPGFVAIDVPAGGREIKIYLTPLETTAPDNSSVVTFSVTDIESGAPVHSALVNVDGVAKYVGASGTAWFILPENTSHDWVVSSPNHWPIGGNFTLGVDDLAIPVSLTRKTSDLPRPPLPELPNFPVIHPSLDPAGFRMQILSVPLLGSLASPLLDTVDSLGVGLNDMVTAVLDVLTVPADKITGAVSSVGQNLIDTATPYLVTSSLLLQVIGAVVSCIPDQVCGLVTFGLLLDIVRILLWGPA